MKLQTQYGEAEWLDLAASDDPVIQRAWIKSVAAATRSSEQDVQAALERGETIEVQLEWHDRIRGVK